ncbi:hypothetical protein PENTCL1PPCAC_7834, partial [Pristionchus entomophagus]
MIIIDGRAGRVFTWDRLLLVLEEALHLDVVLGSSGKSELGQGGDQQKVAGLAQNSTPFAVLVLHIIVGFSLDNQSGHLQLLLRLLEQLLDLVLEISRRDSIENEQILSLVSLQSLQLGQSSGHSHRVVGVELPDLGSGPLGQLIGGHHLGREDVMGKSRVSEGKRLHLPDLHHIF